MKKTIIYDHHLSLQVRTVIRADTIKKVIIKFKGEKTHSNPNTTGSRMAIIAFGLMG
jgi:hypothetical protein